MVEKKKVSLSESHTKKKTFRLKFPRYPREHFVLDSDVDISKLSEKEKWRVEHQRLHERHRGHESMHAELAAILVVTLMVAQILLVLWKTRHFKSYQRVTLAAMWLIPAVLAVKLNWSKFLYMWLIFSIVTSIVTYKSSRKPVSPTTPRWVYKWFLLLYKMSYAAGVLGYLVVMLTIFRLNVLVSISSQSSMDFGLALLMYGLYFGVVSRDFAEVCSTIMASQIGYYSPSGLPAKMLAPDTCAVCGNQVFSMGDDSVVIEKSVRLNCGHVFHEFCIRGWSIVGKKQTCPYCRERVDLKRMFPGPWSKAHVMFGSLLDWMRYLVAWQPVIIGLVQAISWALGLE